LRPLFETKLTVDNLLHFHQFQIKIPYINGSTNKT